MHCKKKNTLLEVRLQFFRQALLHAAAVPDPEAMFGVSRQVLAEWADEGLQFLESVYEGGTKKPETRSLLPLPEREGTNILTDEEKAMLLSLCTRDNL